jgi:23S rRNA (cytidine1920-2'-O)/16S rRNA (cytidine1409-2'-O)-methyltransferase
MPEAWKVMAIATNSQKLRLDELLVQRGLYATRSRARDAVARGTVRVAGAVVQRPGVTLAAESEIEVIDPAQTYVSRAALKLIAGLEQFRFSPAGLNALDIGASTGGFTQVLLEQGAAHVTAVDVGHDQLHASLLKDSRIANLEGLNARGLTGAHLGGRGIGIVVSDVSFISLKLALPNALALAETGAVCVLLVKPQFEAGRERIGKNGLLKAGADADAIALDLSVWLDTQPNWRSVGFCPSPIDGGDGNREFLLGGVKDRT